MAEVAKVRERLAPRGLCMLRFEKPQK